MPIYTVRDSQTGKTVKFDWKAETPPGEEDFKEIFSAAGITPTVLPSVEKAAPMEEPLPGEIYRLGHDPRQTFLQRMGETMLDPTEWPGLFLGGAVQAARMGQPAIKGGIDWLLRGAPSLLKGGKRGAAAFFRGLAAPKREAAIPVEKAVPIPAEEVEAALSKVTAPSITELAQATLRTQPKIREVLPTKSPTSELLKAAQQTMTGRLRPPPAPGFKLSAEEILQAREMEKKIIEWVQTHPEDPLSRIAQGWLSKQKKLPSLTRNAIIEKLGEIPPPRIKPPGAGTVPLSEPPIPSVSKSPLTQERRTLLNQIHIKQRQLGLDDITYRDNLESLFGKRSARELSDDQLREAIKKMGQAQSTLATQPTITKTGTSTPPPTGGPPSSASSQTALSDAEWQFLKTPSETPPGRTFWSRVKETGKGGVREVHSPYEVFRKEPSGLGWDLWEISERLNRYQNVFLQNQYTAFRKEIPFGPGSPQSNLVGELLDKFTTWDEVKKGVPSEIDRLLTPEIKKAFIHIRENWSKLGDDLISRGLMEPTRKIGAYLFHMFDRNTVYQAWKDELVILSRTGANPDRIQKLAHSIDTFERTGTLLYDVLPKSLNIPFLNPRKGAPGYSLDAVRAYNAWLKYYSKKLYVEPVLKVGQEAMKSMSPEFRQYTKEYLRRYADLDKDWALAPFERALTSLEYLKDLGWNSRSALVNATQHLNTLVELGPKGPAYMMRALRFSQTPEGKVLWNESGHAAEVPELRWGLMEKHIESGLRSAFWLFDKVELGNRKLAYLSGYLKAISEGQSIEVAKKLGDEVIRKTQFLYGKVGAPMLMTRPGGRVGMQFTTFTIKQLELMSNWARKNPLKLAAFITIASATQDGLSRVGIDMSNALGMGVDIGELTEAMGHLGRGEGRAAWVSVKAGLPQIPFTPFVGGGSGILPSGIAPAINTVSNLLQGKWERALPVVGERGWTAGRALAEGELPEGGYPIRVPGAETLRHRETPLQLLGRTLFFRPTVESEAQKKIQKERMFEESRRSRMQRIIELRLAGEYEKAGELAREYGRPTPQMLRAEKERRKKTTEERRMKQYPRRGVLGRYKRRIGEEEEVER